MAKNSKSFSKGDIVKFKNVQNQFIYFEVKEILKNNNYKVERIDSRGIIGTHTGDELENVGIFERIIIWFKNNVALTIGIVVIIVAIVMYIMKVPPFNNM